MRQKIHIRVARFKSDTELYSFILSNFIFKFLCNYAGFDLWYSFVNLFLVSFDILSDSISLWYGVLACSYIFLTLPLILVFLPENCQSASSALKIATAKNITYYDASFIALAKDQKTDLVTDNPKRQKKYKRKDVNIIPLKTYE